MEHPFVQFYRTFGLTFQPNARRKNSIVLMDRWQKHRRGLIVEHAARRRLLERLQVCPLTLMTPDVTAPTWFALEAEMVGIAHYKLRCYAMDTAEATCGWEGPSWLALAAALEHSASAVPARWLVALLAQVAGRPEYRDYYSLKQ